MFEEDQSITNKGPLNYAGAIGPSKKKKKIVSLAHTLQRKRKTPNPQKQEAKPQQKSTLAHILQRPTNMEWR